MKNKIFLVFFLLGLICSQEKDFSYQKTSAAGMSFLISSFNNALPIGNNRYYYYPMLLQGVYYKPLINKVKRHQLLMSVELAFAPVLLKEMGLSLKRPDIYEYKTAFEGGAVLAFLYQFLITPDLLIAAGLGSGPYYYGADTPTYQKKGYLFSDHVMMILRQRLKLGKDHLGELVFHARYRHMSNADIFQPNKGIDNILMGLGFSYLFTKKQNKTSQ